VVKETDMRRWTAKPCPGCGKTANGRRFRPTDGVCRECLEAIAIGRAVREQDDAAIENGEAASGQCNIHFRTGPIQGYEGRDAVERAICELAEAVGNPLVSVRIREQIQSDLSTRMRGLYGYWTPKRVPMVGQSPTSGSYGDGEYFPTLRLPKGVIAAFQRLVEAVEEASGRIYHAGYVHGADALTKLASGEMTLDDFTRKVEESGRR